MNKKKIATLILSGIMLMGAAGFGAYSWFKSSATVTSNLIVETGTLSVTAEEPNDYKETNGWILQNTSASLGDDQTEATTNKNAPNGKPIFEHVRPGDKLTKKVIITNNGNLKERLNFNVNNKVENEYKNVVSISLNKVTDQASKSVKNLSSLNGMVLNPKQTITAEIDVSILPTTTGDTINGKTVHGTAEKPNWQGYDINLDEVLGNNELIQVNGEQVNENPVATPTQK